MSQQNKDKRFIYFCLAFVVVFIVLLLGGLLAIASLSYYIQENDYVLCNVYDLEKANKVIYGTDTAYIDNMRVNFTLGVMNNGDS